MTALRRWTMQLSFAKSCQPYLQSRPQRESIACHERMSGSSHVAWHDDNFQFWR